MLDQAMDIENQGHMGSSLCARCEICLLLLLLPLLVSSSPHTSKLERVFNCQFLLKNTLLQVLKILKT